ncbi:MAG: 5'-methylthioadenosine/S-adenosylhomocysteine nucleosidase [Brevundimonas sp.]|uniref:5'-methylthioadenosine/S-adenosylhomocysteine nucleosidase n=1 Tax=Brevundimonas sp. TaxID=1871086 RepID=UPI0025C251FD|nr:5'-methylthioadenosine/S-adenosylhomocysteine nucleosidase [Brevundimonas sp.]MBX3476083.1 5'-methylthioadenosine/S-adenosylhomocysteine nucleosidase [Brevundimonas sp.]
MRLERYGDVVVLPVMAAPAEYGEHLRARIDPLMTGIGPVEAAVSLTAALARLEATGQAPDLVVSLGSCGSRVLDHAAVYQASSVAYRDMDASPLGFERGITPLLDLPAVLTLPCPIAGVPCARLSTGANVVSGAAYDAIAAEMVDMETWALVRAAQTFGVPLIALRGVSDGKAELKVLSDWTGTLHLVDANLAAALDRLTDGLQSQGLSLLEMTAGPGQDPAQSPVSETIP